MPKKTPMRQCIGCGEMKPKKEMLRIVRTPEGEIHTDLSGKMNGRGAYLCRKPECLEKAFAGKGLNRSFKMNVGKETLDVLRKEMELIG